MIKVLLADDDAEIRSALSELLSSDPQIEVVAEAVDGKDALDVFGRLQPDVAVLDVRMPHGGASLVREFRERGVPVVCFSADLDSREQMLEAGALRFLVKGDGGEDITAVIREVASAGE